MIEKTVRLLRKRSQNRTGELMRKVKNYPRDYIVYSGRGEQDWPINELFQVKEFRPEINYSLCFFLETI